MARGLNLTMRLEDGEDGESSNALRSTARNRVRAAQLVAMSDDPGEAFPILMDLEEFLEAAEAMDRGKKVKPGVFGQGSQASLSDIRRHARILRLAITACAELEADKRPLEELAFTLELSLDPIADNEEEVSRDAHRAFLKRRAEENKAE